MKTVVVHMPSMCCCSDRISAVEMYIVRNLSPQQVNMEEVLVLLLLSAAEVVFCIGCNSQTCHVAAPSSVRSQQRMVNNCDKNEGVVRRMTFYTGYNKPLMARVKE